MKYTTIRLGAVGASVGTAGILIASGVASAMPMNGTNYQSMQDSKTTSDTYQGRMHMKHMKRMWDRLNPAKVADPQSTTPISSGELSYVTTMLSNVKTNWMSTGSDPTWTPSGTNWQATWSNWNPMLWEQNGSTYANWSGQLAAYLSATYPGLSSELSTIGL